VSVEQIKDWHVFKTIVIIKVVMVVFLR